MLQIADIIKLCYTIYRAKILLYVKLLKTRVFLSASPLVLGFLAFEPLCKAYSEKVTPSHLSVACYITQPQRHLSYALAILQLLQHIGCVDSAHSV